MKLVLSLLFLLLTFISHTAAQNFALNIEQREKDYISANTKSIGEKVFPAVYGEKKTAAETARETPAFLPQIAPYVRPTKKQRFKRYLSDAFGVPAIIGSVFGAGISQITNNPPEWKRTTGGYGKRFASSYGTNVIRNSISYGLSETFKLDNRFEKSGQKNFGRRFKHVLVSSYTTRTKNGSRIPDFPQFIGTYGASIIANEVWMPDRFSYKDGLRDGTISLGTRFGVNLIREFFWK